MPKTTASYDLVIIGSGPGGFAAANRGLDFGLKVCLIEGGHLGGSGIMNGALTSKTMYELSMDYSVASRVDRGYRASGLTVDYRQLRKTIFQAAKEKQYQMRSQIETFQHQSTPKGSITLVTGHASFLDPHTLEVKKEEEIRHITGQNFLIATGSRPREYPGLPIDGTRIINSDGILSLSDFPERLLIIGSGIIGCEFATIFSNFKQTEVHLLDRANRVLPSEDDDISSFVSKNLENSGVNVHHTAQLRTINKCDTHLEVVLDYDDGHSKVIEVDAALIAIGRVPNTDNMGLEKAGIQPDQRGNLPINDEGRVLNDSNHSHLFAAGDITGQAHLYSVAEFQGRLAVESIMNAACYAPDYSNMSTLMFFKPEVAAVGANEKTLQQAGIPYKAAYYSNQLVNRAIAMRNTNGFIKILVSNDNELRILGMRAAGPQASAFIVSVAHLINQGNSLQEVLKIFYPHPSIAEGIQECLRSLASKSIYKSRAFPTLIEVREWKNENNGEKDGFREERKEINE